MFFQKLIFKSHLDEAEELLFVAHKHWFEIAIPLAKFAIFGLLFPWTLWLFVDFHFGWIILWHLAFLGRLIYQTTDWYLDALLVTNTSVVNVKWHGILHRTSSRADYTDIKEISYEINGIWATILNFGIIYVHLHSGGEMSLQNVRNPKKTELIIKGYKDRFLHDQKMTDADSIQEILSDIVQRHILEHGIPKKKKKPKHREKLERKEF